MTKGTSGAMYWAMMKTISVLVFSPTSRMSYWFTFSNSWYLAFSHLTWILWVIPFDDDRIFAACVLHHLFVRDGKLLSMMRPSGTNSCFEFVVQVINNWRKPLSCSLMEWIEQLDLYERDFVEGPEVIHPPNPNGDDEARLPFSAATLDKLVEIITSQHGEYVGERLLLFLAIFCYFLLFCAKTFFVFLWHWKNTQIWWNRRRSSQLIYLSQHLPHFWKRW